MTNTELFAKYLQENGLTHANHQRILEVLNAPSNSISRYIDKNSFLLNNLVTEEELREYGLEGEIGTLTEDGITFPKKIIAKYHKENLKVPTITDFDLIMGNGISNTSFIAGDFPQDKLFGFCSDIDNPNLNLRLSRAKSLVESYNEKSQGTYELQRDKDKKKVYCLVRRVK